MVRSRRVRWTYGELYDRVRLAARRGRRIGAPCRNVVIVGCQAEARFGFIACGSEQSGGIENVYAHAIRSFGRGVGNAVWLKANSRRGGYTRNVNVSGFRGHASGAVVSATMAYGGQSGPFPPLFEGVHLDDFAVDGADAVLEVSGLPASPIRDFTLSNSTFSGVDGHGVVRHAEVTLRDVRVDGQPMPSAG